MTALRLLRAHGLRVPSQAVSNGVDLARFTPGAPDPGLRERLGLPRPARSSWPSARLSPEKRLDVLIAALARLPATPVDGGDGAGGDGEPLLVLAGAGPEEQRLRSLARHYGVADRVRFPGFIPDGDMPGLYRLADVFAIASQAELQSLATMAAMASGLPVAAVDAGALGRAGARGGERLPGPARARRGDGRLPGPALPGREPAGPHVPGVGADHHRARPAPGARPVGNHVPRARPARSGRGATGAGRARRRRREERVKPMPSREQSPLPLLFLIGDTGGGHRSAATAVAQALERLQPGRFVPVICDPLRGPDVPRLLRWFSGLYGPCIRLTPWLWWLFWRTSNSPRGLGAVRRTIMAPVYGTVARAAESCRPALIVAFHPMTADPAVRARDAAGPLAPVITVITDLITAHLSWRDAAVDRVVVPSAEMAARCARDEADDRYVPLGLPVAAEFCQPTLDAAERQRLKRELGVDGEFLVVLTGGAEGSGGLRRRAAAILRQVDDVNVAVICGRNRSLNRRVSRLAGRSGHGRLTAHGFVGNMADWLRCADVVVGKAGPGTIAEATCCGAPLVLTSYVPGQEKGNAQFVTGAGAGVYASRPRQLAAEVGRLRGDPGALAAMRAAAARVSRPGAASDIARFLADLSVAATAPASPAATVTATAGLDVRPASASAGAAAGEAAAPGGRSGRDRLPTLIAD